MKTEHVVQINGKQYVQWAGLLNAAHEDGLKRITETIVQLPTDANGNVAVVVCEIETETGVFSGIGDASPSNVARHIVPHLLRMASTRAKSRALRDATNIGMASVDEIDDGRSRNRPNATSSSATSSNPSNGRPGVNPGGITQGQQKLIEALSARVGEEFETDGLTQAEATTLINDLRARLKLAA